MDASSWDERYAANELVWSSTPNQFVEQELTGLTPGRAVDLAAGEGRNAIWLAGLGWRVTAVDFSSVALEKGQALATGHDRPDELVIDWVHGDVLTRDLGSEPYDLALLAYLQLEATPRRVAVRRAFECLGVGGTLFVIAHDSTNLTEGTGGPTSAEVLYTAEDVLADLDGMTFEVQRAERVARVVPAAEPVHKHVAAPDRTAYDALVRLVRRA